MKKVYFNATILNNKPTGLGVYTINILKRLDKYEILDTVIFNNIKEERRYSYLVKNAKTTNIQNNNKFNAFYRSYLLNKFIKSINNPSDIILYSPTQHGVKYKEVHQIITIHDLIPIFYPSGRWHQYIYYKFILPNIIKNSDKIITISNNTRKDIIKYYKIDVKKIDVIYNGYNAPKVVDKEKSIKYIYDKYKLKDYLLMVGINYKYKNLHNVIKAYAQIRKDIDNKLAIVGNYNNSYGKELKTLVEKLNLSESIIFLGYVNDDDLEKLYQAAKIFIYPSLYEGFGLPPLEAMANGTLVLCSNSSSLPEVIGKGGIMFNPNSIEYIKQKVLSAYNYDINTINLYKNFAYENILRFNWDHTVKKIYNLL
ncbi:glycosyltransferase family 4 protein [Clostridium tyrobutyricum]|uniref:glycosyltransferase family 4 protein n=1 Tax=Clostridium tyrobutyricum TaxID=1519 RepID=UPI001C382884|nr:glycosyltransferase family 1 protein [Clostridium tyrobutyricum]MBV4421609.1 glycosyltransferase family 4 protein [Clostridium tyrobutyricum]